MWIDYFRIAWQGLTKRRLRSWLTLLGICIGIATVVSLIGLGEGLRDAVTGQFNLVSNDVITIRASGTGGGPPGTGVVNPLMDSDVDALGRLSGVKEIVGQVIETTQITFRDDSEIGYIRAIPDDEPEILYDILKIDIEQGRFIKARERNKVFVGSDYATDEFDSPVKLGNKIEISGEEFEVVGILEATGSFITDGSIYANQKTIIDLFEREEEKDLILVQVTELSEVDNVKNRIERTLRKERNVDEGEEDFDVETAASAVSGINSVLTGVNFFVAALAMISIIVGGIGIANTMFTSVLERTGQIGIMKAIGAQNKDIFFIFLFESGLLGAIGGLVGIIIGVGFAHLGSFAANQAFGTELFQVNIAASLIVASFFGAFILGGIAGIVPALRAAKLRPVVALSYGK